MNITFRDQKIRQEFGDAANLVSALFIQALYAGVKPKFPLSPRALFQTCAPLVTLLDFSHPLYPLDRISDKFRQELGNWAALFGNVKIVKFGSVENPDFTLCFIKNLIGKTGETALEFRDPIDATSQNAIKEHFPESTFGNVAAKPLLATSRAITQAIQNELESDHPHGLVKKATVGALCEVPFVGPIVSLGENLSFVEPLHPILELGFFASQMAESTLHTLEIAHVTGIAHTAMEASTFAHVALTAVPIIGTAFLTFAIVKHLHSAYRLGYFRSDLLELKSRVINAVNDKSAQSEVQNFISSPKEIKLEEIILKARAGTDPRFFEELEKSLVAAHVNNVIGQWKARGQKEIFKGLQSAVSKSLSQREIVNLLGRMTYNVTKRLALKIAEIVKTAFFLSVSTVGIFIPLPLLVSIPALVANLTSTAGLAFAGHMLSHKKFA